MVWSLGSAQYLVDDHRLVYTLGINFSPVTGLITCGQLRQCAVGHKSFPTCGNFFDTCGEIHGVPDKPIFTAPFRADIAGDNIAGVQRDTGGYFR